jgi:hypothetical protein
MQAEETKPRVVLLCHADDRIDTEGLASWIASSMTLAGVIRLHEPSARKWKRIRNEIRRVGWLRFLDVLAFRVYYRLRLARADAAWTEQALTYLKTRYPARLDNVPALDAATPGTDAVRDFVLQCRADLMIARCKFILKPEIFNAPRCGTFIFHPGICPEYRNAHGCFWALAKRDVDRVGMTLLKADAGVDTGPALLHGTYAFDEVRESHVVIQYRAVLENLDRIANILRAVCAGVLRPLPVEGRHSGSWGQPWLTAYWKWKRAARRAATTPNEPPITPLSARTRSP